MSFVVVFLGLPGLNHDIPFSMQRGQGLIRGALLCWTSPHKTCFAIVSEKHINTFQTQLFPALRAGNMTINHHFPPACMEGRDQSGESCSGHPFTKLVSESCLRRILYDSMQFFLALRAGECACLSTKVISPTKRLCLSPQKKVICVSPRKVICVAPIMSS